MTGITTIKSPCRRLYRNLLHEVAEKYRNCFFPPTGKKSKQEFTNIPLNTPDKVSEFISNLLEREGPCMISRFGSVELSAAIFYGKGIHPLWFLRKTVPFWVPSNVGDTMVRNAGFFPNDKKFLSDFADLLISSAKEVDLLGSWISNEKVIGEKANYEQCFLLHLEPYWSTTPWTKSLKNKKIVVVHPFAKTIIEQYEKHTLLFDNPDLLPQFNLTVIKAVQSIGGVNNGFNTWFDALHYMENQIDSVDYDIALIGCGAYGMPLAAHCKKKGKKAVHLGGALQLLFGIKGHRWESGDYKSEVGFIYGPLLNNPHWVRPTQDETPSISNDIENACYW